MVTYAGMKIPQEEIFKVHFILHVRFFASSEVCSSESTIVGFLEVCDVLVSSPGQPLSLVGTQDRRTL